VSETAAAQPLIYISYAVEDPLASDTARALAAALERAGFGAMSAAERPSEMTHVYLAQGAFVVVSRRALDSQPVREDVAGLVGKKRSDPAFALLPLALGVTARDLTGSPLEPLADFQMLPVEGPESPPADSLVEALQQALASKSPVPEDAVSRKVVIRGRVQGVGFRDALRRVAAEQGVSGWVQNSADGTVEAVLEGDPDAVERVVAFAREGPPGARVDEVDVSQQAPEGLSGFNLAPEPGGAQERQEAPVPGERVEWIPDSADAVSRADLLKRRPLARALAVRLRRIRADEPDASFLIHVDGPWGSGKSTLLDFLAEELGKQEEDPWLVVRYDAWRQTRVGPPWWTLLVHLRQTLASRLPLSDRFSLRLAEMRFRIRTAGLLYLLVLAVAVALFVLIGPDRVVAYITAITALVGGAPPSEGSFCGAPRRVPAPTNRFSRTRWRASPATSAGS
jgi:acylphosphatase